MSDLIRKMCAAYEGKRHETHGDYPEAMRAALAVMADNVTDEMRGAFAVAETNKIAAAIREAGK
jgi:hypothetical protein